MAASNVIQSAQELVELSFKGVVYTMDVSALRNPANKILLLPDGTAIDATQLELQAQDRHGNPLARPRLVGSNPEFEAFGKLPVVGVIRVKPPNGAA